jgi:hypothetical protein
MRPFLEAYKISKIVATIARVIKAQTYAIDIALFRKTSSVQSANKLEASLIQVLIRLF